MNNSHLEIEVKFVLPDVWSERKIRATAQEVEKSFYDVEFISAVDDFYEMPSGELLRHRYPVDGSRRRGYLTSKKRTSEDSFSRKEIDVFLEPDTCAEDTSKLLEMILHAGPVESFHKFSAVLSSARFELAVYTARNRRTGLEITCVEVELNKSLNDRLDAADIVEQSARFSLGVLGLPPIERTRDSLYTLLTGKKGF